MQKYVLAALLATVVISGKIPLSKAPISKATFNHLKERLNKGEISYDNAVNGHIALKDYMNT